MASSTMENQDVDLQFNLRAKTVRPQDTQAKECQCKESYMQGAWMVSLPVLFFAILVLHFVSTNNIGYIFWIVAILHAIVYGRYAFEIHGLDANLVKNNWQRNAQYWLNGFGAFVGWVALYILLFYRVGVDDTSGLGKYFLAIDWQDFVLALVAFFGITGYFPYASLLGRVFSK